MPTKIFTTLITSKTGMAGPGISNSNNNRELLSRSGIKVNSKYQLYNNMNGGSRKFTNQIILKETKITLIEKRKCDGKVKKKKRVKIFQM